MDQQQDEMLLQQIQEGDGAAFAQLVQRHTRRFYAVAYRFTADRVEAEDMVQDAFLKLWERPDIWQPGKHAKFTTWFYRVVVNLCLDVKKKKTPLPLEDDNAWADDKDMQDEVLILKQKQRRLEGAIATLPERQKVALNLCFYEGLSNQEAADVMEIPLKALQSLLMRAKTTLKEKIG